MSNYDGNSVRGYVTRLPTEVELLYLIQPEIPKNTPI
jgi:hypothetical protein